MKKALWTFLLMGALTALLCTTALAAEPTEAGIYELTVENGYAATVTLTPETADRTAVSAATAEISGGTVDDFYAGAVRIQMTYSEAQDGYQYLVLALSDTTGVPTEGNIAYIDQDGSHGSSAAFNLYPSKLEMNKTYGIYLSSNAETGITVLTRVATFKCYAPYKLGDVDEDGNNSGRPTASDALYTLEASVGKRTLSSNQLLASDADRDGNPNGRPTASDALYILEASVGKREL